jgi:uncharacterized membrane protein YciS (DUF1049 family)
MMIYEIVLIGAGCIVGFNLGWFYCQTSYVRYKKTVDSIERKTYQDLSETEFSKNRR